MSYQNSYVFLLLIVRHVRLLGEIHFLSTPDNRESSVLQKRAGDFNFTNEPPSIFFEQSARWPVASPIDLTVYE
jgi:hypothetical protein